MNMILDEDDERGPAPPSLHPPKNFDHDLQIPRFDEDIGPLQRSLSFVSVRDNSPGRSRQLACSTLRGDDFEDLPMLDPFDAVVPTFGTNADAFGGGVDSPLPSSSFTPPLSIPSFPSLEAGDSFPALDDGSNGENSLSRSRSAVYRADGLPPPAYPFVVPPRTTINSADTAGRNNGSGGGYCLGDDHTGAAWSGTGVSDESSPSFRGHRGALFNRAIVEDTPPSPRTRTLNRAARGPMVPALAGKPKRDYHPLLLLQPARPHRYVKLERIRAEDICVPATIPEGEAVGCVVKRGRRGGERGAKRGAGGGRNLGGLGGGSPASIRDDWGRGGGGSGTGSRRSGTNSRKTGTASLAGGSKRSGRGRGTKSAGVGIFAMEGWSP